MNPELYKTPKFDPATRKLVRKRIKALYREGKKYAEIAETLHAEGIKTPSGKVPDASFVFGQSRYIHGIRPSRGKVTRRRRQAPRKQAPVATYTGPANDAPPMILAVLTDPGLAPEKKLALITAYYQ